MSVRAGITVALLLEIMVLCLFGQALNPYCSNFHEFVAALLSVQGMLLACLAVWCGTLVILTFSLNDLPLIVLHLIAVAAYFISYATQPTVDAIILLTGVMLGRGARVLLNEEGRMKNAESETGNNSKIVNRKSAIVNVLVGLIGLLAFSALWHLDMTGTYHGPRWMGLWNNPNIYGILMSAGTVLALALIMADRRWEMGDSNSNAEGRMQNAETTTAIGLITVSSKLKIKNSKLAWFLCLAAGMMAVGLVMSYSRGAWVATAVGLLYLAWCYGKLKWRWVLPGVLAAAVLVCVFWHSTADNAPWYLKRMDFGRPSAQHRVSAWRGAVQMMWDHPLGVGWNQAVSVYEKNYSPPEGGGAALTMNSYLMLGTELGVPALVCLVAYVGLCFKNRPHLTLTLSPPAAGSGEGIVMSPITRHLSLQVACRAGAIVLLVAFWFDGGLFNLPTAAVFWVLLELGKEKAESGKRKAETIQKLAIGCQQPNS